MKVLWVVNIPIMGLSELANTSNNLGAGTWLNTALTAFFNKQDYEIGVVCPHPVSEIKKKKVDNITYYLIPGGYPSKYQYSSRYNETIWEHVMCDFAPNLLQIWGTEFTHGYLAMKVMSRIPSIVYIQGLLKPISDYYTASLTARELRKSLTLKDIILRKTIKCAQKSYLKKSIIEAKMLKLARNIIIENNWCHANCYDINPNCSYNISYLPISLEFFDKEWNIKNICRHTIFCNAGGYPLKGTHILLKALRVVKQSFPNVKLKIPGMINWDKMGFRQKYDGYISLIHKLIKEYDLEENIEFMGVLSTKEMANEISKANVYVMPSCLENHSSSLIEALCVGAPCVASAVGGVPEYVIDNENGKLYRFEEYRLLAQNIINLFSDDNLCIKYSENAVITTKAFRKEISIFTELDNVYNSILNK